MKERIKIIISLMLRGLLHVFYVFPVRNNRIMMNSYMGRQYSCNPKYITEYLLQHDPGRFEIVWNFNSPKDFQYLKDLGIKICRTRSLLFYYYRMTSRVLICNGTIGAEVPKRKSQYSINTWHGGGGGYKKMGEDVKHHQGVNNVRSAWEKKALDLFCASSVTMLQNTVRKAFHHEGDFFRGTPRNDMFIRKDREDIRGKVFQTYQIPGESHLLLYAPTFREFGDRNIKEHDYGLDFEKLHEMVTARFGGDWIIAIRYHYYITKYTIPERSYLIDASRYSDMQELLYAADMLVTDYSSSIWDYSFTNRPCFLYCNDLAEYETVRGFNKPIREWGFPVATTNEELWDQIMKWDEEEHRDKMNRHHEENGSFEDGSATERICRIIREKCRAAN